MAQFTAYQNPNPATRGQYPCLLDVQANLLDELRTVLIVPLCPSETVSRFTIARLNPVLEIHGSFFTAMTQDMAAMHRNQLGPAVCDLADYRSEIIAAVDFLLAGI